ncbi:ribosome-inactivating family protein [Spiroplasma endosymbiont of Megaselia nigra]|uniref:ribosome-inactivating family protein n=1 Tax=Spiroplasma endosymbiont of Megaselia nigra TaxID=2478537 RepID=UPI000F898C20|nr:ribosome-inactivating family protein [Spiroplasma endosymbiont of Megaselia nigra]RUO86534.1 hypothetical protein D9R21_02475 [Spiroplasma endosymbiont of Megaselia nigra]
MKKLLSLLSVLTISGTSMPSVIAANPYQKEKSKLENIVDNKKINTNNLENLNRVKRGNKKPKNDNKQELTNENNAPSTSNTNKKCNNRGNKKCPIKNEESSLITTKSAKERILDSIKSHSNNIFKITNNKYKDFLRESINYFQETKNIIHETINPFTGKYIFKIKKHNVEDSYKKIPLNIEGNKIDLILNKSNLYVDGIITHNNGDGTEKKLFYFSDSNLAKNAESLNSNDKYKLFGKILDLEIKTDDNLSKLSHKLYFDSNYNTLTSGEENIKINKENIKKSIINLSKINEENQQDLKNDFLRVIFTTAESTRFFSIRDEVKKVLSSSDSNPYEINWQDHKDTLTNWDKNSQKYYEMKDSIELQLKMTLEEKQKIYNVAVLAVKDDEKIRTIQRE